VRIGEVADRSGVPAKTIRYYETLGLLPAPDRTANGYRAYDSSVLGRLAFIRAAQASGLTLGEIRGVLGLRDRGETPCAHVRGLIDRRARELDERIAELTRLRTELARLSTRARRLDPTDCDPAMVCHILTANRE
jgi:DNA-binding transcriptional MerR regulator